MRSPEVLTRPRASAQGSQTFGIPPFAIVGRDDHLDWLSTSSPKPRHTRADSGPASDKIAAILAGREAKKARSEALAQAARNRNRLSSSSKPAAARGAKRKRNKTTPGPTVFGFVGCKCTINPRNPKRKRVPPSECILRNLSVALERPLKNALARSRLLAPREHVAPQAPGGAQLLALDKAVHPLAAAEVELPLDTARAGL